MGKIPTGSLSSGWQQWLSELGVPGWVSEWAARGASAGCSGNRQEPCIVPLRDIRRQSLEEEVLVESTKRRH